MGVTPVPSRPARKTLLPSATERTMDPPTETNGRVLDAGASVSLPDDEVQPISAETQGYVASTDARTVIGQRSTFAESTAKDAVPPGSRRSFLQAWAIPKPSAGDHTDWRFSPANAYSDKPGIADGAGPNNDWPTAYSTSVRDTAEVASTGPAGDSTTVGTGLDGIGGCSANRATGSVGRLLGSEDGGLGRPDMSGAPGGQTFCSAAMRLAGDGSADGLRADEGSSVTAMTRATASAASAQDRAVTRRGSGFAPVAATTNSAITPPCRGIVKMTRAVYAASSANRIREERADTPAMISFPEAQSDLAGMSSRTVDTSAPSEGPLFSSNEISRALTEVIARDGSISRCFAW